MMVLRGMTSMMIFMRAMVIVAVLLTREIRQSKWT